MGYKQDGEAIVQIDQNHLDRECINLPNQYVTWAFRSAEAKRDMDEAKAALDVCSAEVAQDIRQHPDKYDLEKVSEKAIEALVPTTKAYKAAQKTFFRAKHAVDMSQAVVWALEHKKRALTLLVELHGMGYFGNVKISADGKAAVERMTAKRSVHKRKGGVEA